jgi:hypothetical protein
MRTSLTLFCILIATITGFSQDKSFDLSKYKFPDYKRHELEFNFSSNGNSDKRGQDELFPTGDGTTVRKDYLQSNFNSNFSLGYQYDYLTRKRIDYLTSNLSGTYDYSMSKYDGVKTKNYSPNINLNLNGSRKYYLKEDKLFLEGMAGATYYFDETKSTSTNMDDRRSSYDQINLSIGVGVGTGRMEKVNDLWQAYYILEKLAGQKSLARELAEKDIIEFASFASKLKNKRFFDARLQKIAELQALDSLLHKQGLIKDTDISYFATLNDYWSYGNFQDRESGRVLKFGISPEYSKQNEKQYSESTVHSNKTSLVSNVSFNCTKQLNLFWERHFNVVITNETLIDTVGKYYNSYPSNFFSSNVSFGYGYFPDSRTSISGYLGYHGQNLVVLNSSSVVPKQWMNNIYLTLTGNYYISPQLQITGSFNLSYIDKEYTSRNTIHTNYNLGLRYAIF